ncbi:MAG: hypothetical protein AAF707_01575 [Pseudomonadota bacterium]
MVIPAGILAGAASRLSLRSIIALTALAALLGTCLTFYVMLYGFRVNLPFGIGLGPKGWIAVAQEAQADAQRKLAGWQGAVEDHYQTKQNYRAAQAEAAERQRRYVVRVELERKEAINDAVEDLRSDYERIDADYRRLLNDQQLASAGSAAGSAPGDMRLPGDTTDPGGANGVTGCHGLSGRRPAAVQLECDRIATRQAAQLVRLQQAVRDIEAAQAKD